MTVPTLLGPNGAPMPKSSAPPRGGALASDRPTYRASLNSTRTLTPYDAADPWSQELRNWWPWLGSPDTEINPFRDFLVSRIRDLVRNDGWASGTITRLLDNVVGGGFRIVAHPDWKALSLEAKGFDMQWAKEYQSVVQAEFRLWADDIGRYCDLGRRLGWGEMTRLGYRNFVVEGDAIAMMHWRPARKNVGAGRFATCMQIVDPDRLSNPYLVPDQPNMRGGIEIDDDGVAIAYHMRKAHRAQWMEYDKAYSWERVPRETPWGRPVVVHFFDSDRAETHRAVGGVLKPVLARLKMLARYDSVELQAAIINAVLAAFIESPYDPETVGSALEAQLTGGDLRNIQLGAYEDLRSRYHESNDLMLNGARISRLFSGEKLNLAAPSRPAQAFEAFEGAMLRNVASATGLAAEQISQNWAQMNYSSARTALLEAWKAIGRSRQLYADGFCRPIYSCVLEEMHAEERVPLPRNAPTFAEMRTAYSRCRFMGPGRGWIDPVKEAQAAVLRMDAGLTTLEQECAEQGLDYEEVLQQRAFERALFDELGLPHPKWFGDEEPAQQVSAKPVKPLAQ